MANQLALHVPAGPELRSPVHDELLRMHAFLYQELNGADVSEDKGCAVAVDVMTIAAESLGRTMAAVRGGVDPASDDLMSENIMGLLNHDEDYEVLAFNVDSVFYGKDIVDDEMVSRLTDKALEVSNAAYVYARDKALLAARRENGRNQLEIAIPGLQPGLAEAASVPQKVVYRAEQVAAGAHWCGKRALEHEGLTMEDVRDYHVVGIPNDDQETAGGAYYGAIFAAPDSPDFQRYQLLTRSAGLLKLLAKEKAGQDMAELLRPLGALTDQAESIPGEAWILDRDYFGETYVADGLPSRSYEYSELYLPPAYADAYDQLDHNDWDMPDESTEKTGTASDDLMPWWLRGSDTREGPVKEWGTEPIDTLYDLLDEWKRGTYDARELAETAMLRAGIAPPYTIDSNLLALAEREIEELAAKQSYEEGEV